MDTPKKDVLEINNFPTDIWAYLVCYLNGEQLSRLKMTGATALWRKLTHMGVVRSVVLGTDNLTFKSWPSFLNEFVSLENLLIQPKSSTWYDFQLKLNMIPPTVRRLTFRQEDESLGQFFVNDEGGDINLDEQLPELESLDFGDTEYWDNDWLERCPPTLTTLAFPSFNFDLDLPSHLLHLKVYSISVLDYKKGIYLPSTLETLEANRVDYLDWLMPMLPTSLLRLTIRSTGIRDRRLSFAELPRALTHLVLPDMGSWSSIVASTACSITEADEFDPQHFSLLPPNLLKLRILGPVPSSTWPFLPSSLQRFSFEVSHSADHSKPSRHSSDADRKVPQAPCPLELLPRSITHIETIVFNDYLSALWRPSSKFAANLKSPNSTLDVPPYWPPHLTSLDTSDIHLSPDAVSLLPTTLHSLHLRSLSSQQCKNLPSGLTVLTATQTLMSHDLIHFLPKSLTTLLLSAVTPHNAYWYNEQTGERIEPISKFAEFDKHKSFGKKIDPKGDYTLPPRLTNLKLYGFDYMGDSFIAKQKFPQLLHLKLGIATLSDRSISFLNPHLISLSIYSSAKISGKCFPSLPRSLIFLELAESKSIDDSDIVHLPRSLKILNLPHAIHLTDRCVPDLPHNLETLDLSWNEKMTPSSIPHLPYFLRSSLSLGTVSLAKYWIVGGEVRDEEDDYIGGE